MSLYNEGLQLEFSEIMKLIEIKTNILAILRQFDQNISMLLKSLISSHNEEELPMYCYLKHGTYIGLLISHVTNDTDLGNTKGFDLLGKTNVQWLVQWLVAPYNIWSSMAKLFYRKSLNKSYGTTR